MIDTPKKKQLVSLWVAGIMAVPILVMLGILFSQSRSVDAQHTQPGIADYRSGNYPRAIQELNTSIKLEGGDNSYAYYYLGLSLKKTGDVVQARRAFLDARSAGNRQKNADPAFIARCDRAISDMDDRH